jgi:hypothetical protein
MPAPLKRPPRKGIIEMALKPDVSLPIALGTAAVVWGVYSHFMPSVADVKAAQPNNKNMNSTRREATVMSAAVVGGISLLTHDPTIFIVGGAMVVALDLAHRHANVSHPVTGQLVPSPSTGGGAVNPAAGVTGS